MGRPEKALRQKFQGRQMIQGLSTKATEYLQKLGWDQRIITMTETNEREKRYELA